MRIIFTPRAAAQLDATRAWWIANRPSAPRLFTEEAHHAVELIRGNPTIGQLWPNRHR